MVRADIRALLSKLVASNSISNDFLDIFESTIFQNQSRKSSQINLNTNLIVGIYFLFMYNKYSTNQNGLLSTLETDIKKIVENFNTNNITAEEAKAKLDVLVYKSIGIKISQSSSESNSNLLPFSQFKTTIEIEKMFLELEKLNLKTNKEMKNLFIEYFDRFEKNKDKLLVLTKNEYLQSKDFSDFAATLIEETSKKNIIDSSSINDSFSKDIINLFEMFFEKFKRNKLEPIEFSIPLGQTLGDKNNQSYFFMGKELEELEPITEQFFTPNVEMSSKITQGKSAITQQTNLWDMVGAIVVDPVKNGIGIAEFPYEDKKTHDIYIAVRIEQEIDLSESENFYHQIQSMRVSDVSDKTESRRQLVISEISESLDIPANLALFPSIIEEYLARNKGLSIDFEIQKKKLRSEYYLASRIAFDALNGMVTIPDDLEPITHNSNFRLYPSSKINQLVNKAVFLANEHVLGKSFSEFQFLGSWYASIELDLPSKSLLDKIAIKIRNVNDSEQNDLWKLRFTISKVLDIFEAESLLISNLWKYIWHEKIPILPFDLLISFVAMTPSGSISKDRITSESIQLARAVDVTQFESLLKNDPYTIISEQKINIGKALSFYLDPIDKQLHLLYCNISEIDILKKMNRDYSQNSLEKIAKRVSKALNLKTDKLDVALHPKYLLTYILFYSIQFNTQTDFSNLTEVNEWLLEEFELKKVPLHKIKAIDEQNFIIEIEN